VKKQRSPKLGTMVVNESENQMKVFQLVPKRSSWKNIEQLTQTRGRLFCQVLSMVEGESKARQFFPPQDTGYIGSKILFDRIQELIKNSITYTHQVYNVYILISII